MPRLETNHKSYQSPDVGHPPKGDLFGKVAGWTAKFTGGRWGFLMAFGTLFAWAVSGPAFHFSDNWQLVVNTGTNIVTFLMVFLIQNAQNRESKSIHLKLDELILATKRARNELIDVELLNDEQLDRLATRYRKVAEACHSNLDDERFLDPKNDAPQPLQNGMTRRY